MLEETGAQGYSYTSLGQLYPSPGYTNEIIHLYVCRIKSKGESKPDEGEFLDVETKRIFKLFDKEIDLLTNPENNFVSDSKEDISSESEDGEVSDIIDD